MQCLRGGRGTKADAEGSMQIAAGVVSAPEGDHSEGAQSRGPVQTARPKGL